MNAKNIRNLQEAYLEVYVPQELDEEYNLIIPYLIEEGYAETIDEAEKIFANLDEASRSKLSKEAGKLALGVAKVGTKLAWKATKYGLKKLADHGDKQPEGSKRKAISKVLRTVRAATLSPSERKKREAAARREERENARAEARERARAREERAAAREERQREAHERRMGRSAQTSRSSTRRRTRSSTTSGRYRNVGAGRRESIREQVDIYDIILSHLLDEGYAETPEAAEAIMVNMSEEWRDSIIG